MAGKPKKIQEVSEELVQVDVVPSEIEAVEVIKEQVVEETKDEPLVAPIEELIEEPVIVPTIEPIVSEEPTYNPKDIVEFYNNKGDLRYAPYAYITKRGYKALRKYTKKK